MKFRTVCISDTHLGTRGCKDTLLLEFLKDIKTDYLFLVGDIVDGWRMKSSFYWCETHNEIVKEILKKSKKGTQVIWVLGNHDEFLRPYLEHFSEFGNIKIVNEAVHEINGQQFWIVHGDEFDGITRYHKWLALLGDYAYTVLLWANRWFNRFRSTFGMGYWSLSSYLKYKVKSAVNFICEFEQGLAHECKRRGYNGVICGHVHHPEIKMIDGIMYCNDGDFVESCSALVETHDGNLMIIYPTQKKEKKLNEKNN